MSQTPERPPGLPISDEDWAQTPPTVQAHILSRLQPQIRPVSWRRSVFRFSSLMLIIVLTGVTLLGMVSLLKSATQTCILRGGQTYQVQSGDTMFGLSIRFGVPVSTLAAVNGIRDANYLYVHQNLLIPRTYCAPSYLLKDTLAAEATLTSYWLTNQPTATPTADLTKTTATPTSPIDPIYITATYIVWRATATEAYYVTATYLVAGATQTQAAAQTATASVKP